MEEYSKINNGIDKNTVAFPMNEPPFIGMASMEGVMGSNETLTPRGLGAPHRWDSSDQEMNECSVMQVLRKCGRLHAGPVELL
jgi:hypothetical protein